MAYRQYEKHGKRDTTEYRIWSLMIDRCDNPKSPAFEKYGARGITVCDKWRHSFQAFFDDMGERPDGCTLDRKDNAGPYCKENCRWATAKEQARNTRNNVYITAFGKTQQLCEWAEETGIKRATISYRLNHGLSPEEALSEKGNRKHHMITAFGKTQRLGEWAKETGLAHSDILYRLKAGWSPEDAVSPRVV